MSVNERRAARGPCECESDEPVSELGAGDDGGPFGHLDLPERCWLWAVLGWRPRRCALRIAGRMMFAAVVVGNVVTLGVVFAVVWLNERF